MSKYVNAAAVAAVALASGANAENQWFQKGTLFASKWYETCDEILEVAGKEANQANKARCMGQPEEMLEEVMDYRTFCCAGAKLQKPIRDLPLKQGREQSSEIDIPSS